MHLTGPLQTAVIIVYVLLMVTKTLHSSENMEKLVSINTTQYATATVTTISPKRAASLHASRQMKAIKQIFKRIDEARNDIRQQSNVIKEFYSKVNQLNGKFAYEWLPKDHLKWFESKLRHYDKRKKVSTLLPELHRSLIIFKSTFEEMEKFDVDNQHVVQASVYNKRKTIIKQIINDLDTVNDEVDKSMQILNISAETNTSEILVGKGGNWESKPDHTIAMVQDWGVIVTYYKFLKDWYQITKHIYQEFCQRRSRKHRCHGFLNKTSSIT